jgi:hypothetical protein
MTPFEMLPRYVGSGRRMMWHLYGRCKPVENRVPIGSMRQPADTIADWSSSHETLTKMRRFGDKDWRESV